MGWPKMPLDFGRDGKYKSGLDYEKIHVICARCGAGIKSAIAYIPIFDRFDVKVKFFGWECVQGVDGVNVRATTRYEIAFDHCGCMKINAMAPWETTPTPDDTTA